MKNKFCFLVLFLLLEISSNAQKSEKSGFLSGLDGFISWIRNFDSVLTSINDKEKLHKLFRLLGDVNFDIDNVSSDKYILAITISKIDTLNDEKKTQGLISQIEFIQNDISKLLEDLDNLQGLLNQTEIDVTIKEVRMDFEIRKGILLEDIKQELQKRVINKVKVMNEANQSKNIAMNANTEIVKVRNRILTKLEN